jgi:hypothetical protein
MLKNNSLNIHASEDSKDERNHDNLLRSQKNMNKIADIKSKEQMKKSQTFLDKVDDFLDYYRKLTI